jgi:NTP pyrophosphatase (non-canonical NTP hydrolase)
MAKNYIDFERVEMLSAHDTNSGIILANKIIKLGEETGEVSQAYLQFVGSANVSKSASGSDLIEECMDVINVAMDIINAIGISDEDAKEIFDKKLNKWESKLTKI